MMFFAGVAFTFAAWPRVRDTRDNAEDLAKTEEVRERIRRLPH